MIRQIFTIAISITLASCDKEAKSHNNGDQRTSFEASEGEVFRSINRSRSLTLISATECEIRYDDAIILGNYTRQPDGLRVVTSGFGGKHVSYYQQTTEGLKSRDGDTLLNTTAYNREKNLIREAEARRYESLQKERQREQEKKDLIAKAEIELRNKELEWFRSYFSINSLLPCIYQIRGIGKPIVYPMQLTVLEVSDLKVDKMRGKRGPHECEIRFKVTWLGKMPQSPGQNPPFQGQEIVTKASVYTAFNDRARIQLNFYWLDPLTKKYIYDGDAVRNGVKWDEFNRICFIND